MLIYGVSSKKFVAVIFLIVGAVSVLLGLWGEFTFVSCGPGATDMHPCLLTGPLGCPGRNNSHRSGNQVDPVAFGFALKVGGPGGI